MKTILFDKTGKKKTDIELPRVFDTIIREDLVQKYLEAEKWILAHPYSPNPRAGRRHSASGTISHQRHDWKGHYGRGISRVPRKTMWRRGTQFFWVGAEISSARGGRRAHPPKILKRLRKTNKKEIKMAMNSAFASTADQKYIGKRYSSMEKIDIKLPVVVESKLDNIKTKDLLSLLRSVYGDIFSFVMKKKEMRSGKGKTRGRKYKSNAGLLLVKTSGEKIKASGLDIKNVNDVSVGDLYPLGRLTMYTQKAIEELKNEFGGENK